MKALYTVIKATLVKFENLPKSLSPNEIFKISYYKTFYFLRYAHVRYVKSLFTKI